MGLLKSSTCHMPANVVIGYCILTVIDSAAFLTGAVVFIAVTAGDTRFRIIAQYEFSLDFARFEPIIRSRPLRYLFYVRTSDRYWNCGEFKYFLAPITVGQPLTRKFGSSGGDGRGAVYLWAFSKASSSLSFSLYSFLFISRREFARNIKCECSRARVLVWENGVRADPSRNLIPNSRFVSACPEV